MSEHIESTGRTVEEAISEALLQLGARRDEVDIEVIEEGKSGFLGVFGTKPARVIVKRKMGGRSSQRGPRGRSNGHRRSSRKTSTSQGGDREAARTDSSARGPSARNQQRRPSSRPSSRPSAKKAGEPANRAGADRTSDSGSRQGRNSGPTASRDREQPGQERGGRSRNVRARERRPDGVSNGRRQDSSERESRQAGMSEREAQAIPMGEEIQAITTVAPLRGVQIQDAPENLVNITSQLMSLAGFPCRCEIQEGEYHLVKIVTDDSSAGMLIGRHGSTVDAIEHLVERMASQAVGDRVNMNLDVNNYRRRREENLVQRAKELAQKVSSTGKEIHMEPLCARERRIVHLEVVNFPGLRTYTVANYSGKHVVIASGESAVNQKTNGSGYGEDMGEDETGFAGEEITRVDELSPGEEVTHGKDSTRSGDAIYGEDSNYKEGSNRSEGAISNDTFSGRRE